jgi:hypothetical protein
VPQASFQGGVHFIILGGVHFNNWGGVHYIISLESSAFFKCQKICPYWYQSWLTLRLLLFKISLPSPKRRPGPEKTEWVTLPPDMFFFGGMIISYQMFVKLELGGWSARRRMEYWRTNRGCWSWGVSGKAQEMQVVVSYLFEWKLREVEVKK